MSYDYSTGRINIVVLAGNYTLTNDDIGKVFRYEGTSNVTVTVPNNLHSGFTSGFVQYSTGTITIVGGSHAAKVAGGSATGAQYAAGCLVVLKKTGGEFGVIADLDYAVGGDFA